MPEACLGNKHVWPHAFDVTARAPPGVCRKVCQKVCRKVCRKGMSERYVGKLCRKGNRVCRRSLPWVCRRVCRKSGADGCGQGISQLPGACLLRGPSPRRSLGTLAPKDGTKPQCFASRRSGLEPSREWGPGYVGGMSEVCRTRGLWVSPLFRAFSREWGLEP